MHRLPIRSGLVAFLALATMSCGVTTTSTNCKNADCDVKLSGNGAHTDLDALGLTIKLEDTDGDKATLRVGLLASGDGDTVELAEGERRSVRRALITLEDVDGGKVKLHVRPG